VVLGINLGIFKHFIRLWLEGDPAGQN